MQNAHYKSELSRPNVSTFEEEAPNNGSSMRLVNGDPFTAVSSPALLLQARLTETLSMDGEAPTGAKYPGLMRLGGMVLFCGAAWVFILNLIFG